MAQSSFQVSDTQSIRNIILDIRQDSDSLISLSMFNWDTGEPITVELSPTSFKAKGNIYNMFHNGKEYNFDRVFAAIDEIPFYNFGSLNLISFEEGVYGFNNLGNSWMRYDTAQAWDKRLTLKNNVLSVLSEFEDTKFAIHHLEPISGNTIKRSGWKLINEQFIGIDFEEISSFNNSDLLVGGAFIKDSLFKTFIIKIDNQDQVKNKLVINEFQFYDFDRKSSIYISPDDYVYVIGSTKKRINNPERNLLLLKFNQNLELQWSKRYYAENFDHRIAKMSFDASGNPIIAYSTRGAFPVILANLNKDGEILSEKGYALYSPKIRVLRDGSLLMFSRFSFDQFGNTDFLNIIAKTDTNGNIDGCEQYQARLSEEDILVSFDSLEIDTASVPDFGWGTIESKPIEFQFSEYCDFPPPPHPNFHLPDTLCLGNCLTTDSTNNANAHGVEWNLEGDDLQLKVEDSLQFNFCPTEIGTYTLRQTIWFLGIDYSFEKIVEIIPLLEVSLPNDTMYCDTPATIELTSNRPLQNIEWSSGETTSTALIYESGQYEVVADDGYCQANTSANYEFIFDKIDTSLALQIPDSATVCAIRLPFELRPESEYISLFQKENEMPDSVLTFSQSGVYKIKTTIDGCEFSKTFQLKTSECAANVYVPSAFSPNDDGINDSFLPLGSDIQPIRLKIYDRWGGKLFESTETEIAWNGKFNEKSAQQGVYVFQFEYVNLLTGLEEEMSGEVTVMR